MPLLRICSGSRLTFCSRRYFADVSSKRRGIVIGLFENTEKNAPSTSDNFTVAARDINEKSGGVLLKQLNYTKALKIGHQRIFYGIDKSDESLVFSVVGLGKKGARIDANEQIHEGKDSVRKAVAAGVTALKSAGVTTIQVDSCGHPDAAEGAVLSLHTYDKLKSIESRDPHVQIEPLALNDTPSDQSSHSWREGITMAECQNMARTWMDMPANKLTPTEFGAQAKLLFPDALIHDVNWMKEQKMEAFLSVASGSREPPKFLEVHIEPKTMKVTNQRPVVLVGKGVTFDTGGISLKPSASMDMMRGDMGGAAAVLAAAYGASKLALKRKVIVLIPLTENMPGGNAIKPGDIVTARNGKSIKIDNTDAEGRLILADALSYADSFNPEIVVDVATLTGACHVALGSAVSAVFTPNDQLFNALQQAGTDAGDRFWRMPLFKHYRNKMKTSSADLCNISKSTAGGGSCTAAAFLREFTTCDNWVHIDIAGVAGLVAPDEEIPYIKGTMTGRPTRALIKWLLSLK